MLDLFDVCLNYEPDTVLIVLYAMMWLAHLLEPPRDKLNKTAEKRTGFDNLLHMLWPRTHAIIDNLNNSLIRL